VGLITVIDNIPLFTTVEEAEMWGSQYGLTGYHQHTALGQVGYMGGNNHNEITRAVSKLPSYVPQTLNLTPSPSPPPIVSSTPSSGNSGGY